MMQKVIVKKGINISGVVDSGEPGGCSGSEPVYLPFSCIDRAIATRLHFGSDSLKSGKWPVLNSRPVK